MNPSWLHSLPTCASTNSWALDHLDELATGACVWTESQAAGRGQHGRTWLAPRGVLTASFVVDLPIDPRNSQVALIAGLAVAHTAEECCRGATVQIKWPNDCWHRSRKLAGILCEGRISGDRHRVVVGIGLNVDPDWQAADIDPTAMPDGGQPATSLQAMGARDCETMNLLRDLRSRLLEGIGLLKDGRWDVLLTQLQQRDALLGRTVELRCGEQHHIGQAMGIDEDGALLLAQADGIQAHATGTVCLLPATAAGGSERTGS